METTSGPMALQSASRSDNDQVPAEPALEALAHPSRGRGLARDDWAGAGTELDAALALSRLHGFDYLTMQWPRGSSSEVHIVG